MKHCEFLSPVLPRTQTRLWSRSFWESAMPAEAAVIAQTNNQMIPLREVDDQPIKHLVIQQTANITH